jgi:hypothetical protein
MHQDLGFEEDLPFQFKSWRLQRMGWAALALVLGGASLGLFGHGMLADATAQDPSGTMSVDYQRFLRYDTLTRVAISFSDPARTTNRVQVQIHDRYLKDATVHDVMPTPAKVTRTAEGIEFEFFVSQGEPAIVRFSASVQAVGPVTGLIRAVDGDWVRFTHYVYP